MFLRVSAKGLLIAAAVLVAAAKLQSHGISPLTATKELNRCLMCVRVAASRRRGAAPLAKQLRRRADAADRRPEAHGIDCRLRAAAESTHGSPSDAFTRSQPSAPTSSTTSSRSPLAQVS